MRQIRCLEAGTISSRLPPRGSRSYPHIGAKMCISAIGSDPSQFAEDGHCDDRHRDQSCPVKSQRRRDPED